MVKDTVGADIFLSYSREDQGRANALAEALAGQGWSVFWDRTVPIGSTWDDYIGSNLDGARCVVAAWSSASVHSKWVLEEARVGREREVLVPVLFDKVPPPFGFGSIQAADLSAWEGGTGAPVFERLVEDIARMLGPPEAKLTDALEPRENEQAIATDSAESPPPKKTRIVRIPDIVWIEVPAGDFSYGGGEQRVHLDSFWIAKYPITNLQFQTFADDGGYREARWWRDLKKPKPSKPTWQQANRPRTDVDRYGAVAFTRWLTAQLGLAEGAIRLPASSPVPPPSG